MADIFISYAKKDRSRVEQLAKALADQGWSVWWDRDLPFGLPFDEVIRTELRTAGCVVALWTESATKSLYVIGEARDALSLKKLISVFLSLSRTELPYDLQAIQGVELIDWHGDKSNADYQRLVRGITAIVGRPSQKKAKAEIMRKAEEEHKQRETEAKRKDDEEKHRKEQQEQKRKVQEKERRRKIDQERKLREAEQKKAEKERQQLEEEKQCLAELKLELEMMQKRINAERKAEEERKKKETEATQKATQRISEMHKLKNAYFKKLTAPIISNYKKDDYYLISWATVEGAKDYSLECSPVETFPYGTEYYRGTETEYRIPHSSKDINFCRVKAIGVPGISKHSDWSKTLEFRKKFEGDHEKSDLEVDKNLKNRESEWVCRCGTRNPIGLSNCANCHIYKSHVIPKKW